jgi:hypothetical protein
MLIHLHPKTSLLLPAEEVLDQDLSLRVSVPLDSYHPLGSGNEVLPAETYLTNCSSQSSSLRGL